MTSLQKGQFTQFSVQKSDKVVNNDIKLSFQGQVNTENTSQVGRKPPPFLKIDYLQLSHKCIMLDTDYYKFLSKYMPLVLPLVLSFYF